jgi:LPS sulfotransferase NodH
MMGNYLYLTGGVVRLTLDSIQRSAQFGGLLLGRTPNMALNQGTPPKTVLLVSFPRSGTSWLGSVLENFGAPFTYYGELFACLSEAPGLGIIARNYRGFKFRYLRAFIAQRREWRLTSFEDFGLSSTRVLQIMGQQAGINVVKVFPRHVSDSQFETLLREFAPHIVFLRRNHLDRFTSIERAKRTGTWQNAQYREVDIAIDEVELQRVAGEAQAWYREQKALCLSLGLTVTDVAYEDLLDDKNLRTLLETLADGQLSIPANQPLSSSLSKQGGLQDHSEYVFPSWSPTSAS